MLAPPPRRLIVGSAPPFERQPPTPPWTSRPTPPSPLAAADFRFSSSAQTSSSHHPRHLGRLPPTGTRSSRACRRIQTEVQRRTQFVEEGGQCRQRGVYRLRTTTTEEESILAAPRGCGRGRIRPPPRRCDHHLPPPPASATPPLDAVVRVHVVPLLVGNVHRHDPSSP